MLKILWLFIGLVLFESSALGSQNLPQNNLFKYRFYAGITEGYGSTTWEGLVPPEEKQNFALSISIPKYVEEGGLVSGVFAGYEFLPCFALELAYMHFPNAKITFDEMSIFTFDHHGQTEFISKTQSLSLMAKIMLVIPSTSIRAYSSLGIAGTHRSDELNNHTRLGPSFGAGFNYNFTPHLMAELGANYIAGYGESELDPTKDYFPFLYSVFFRLAVRF